MLTSQRRVRVWFQRTAEGPESIKDWVALQEYVHSHRKDETDPLSYAVALATELPRVNAVQVSDGDHGEHLLPQLIWGGPRTQFRRFVREDRGEAGGCALKAGKLDLSPEHKASNSAAQSKNAKRKHSQARRIRKGI